MILDISLNSNIFVTNKLDAAIQELDLLFNTENTELIGDTSYGTNWWTYLWELTPLESDLHNYINGLLNTTYFVSQFERSIEVMHTPGTENSIYYIKIVLFDNEGNAVTLQQYELK